MKMGDAVVLRRFERDADFKSNTVLRLALAAALASGLAGCDAYNKSFNASFDKSVHDSCVKSAVQNSAAPDAAERYCSCMVGQLKDLSVKEKQSLSPASDKVQAAAAHCKAQM